MLVYDCEIAKAIPDQVEDVAAGVQYCLGWDDFSGMGIACICAYEVGLERYHLFCQDNLDRFQALVDRHRVIVGYNAIAFDNRLCWEAAGIQIPEDRTYDLLVEIWKAAGLVPSFQGNTHKGFGLDAVCEANLGYGKSGSGAMAPVLYQTGRIGKLVSYCMDDVWLTAKLLEHCYQIGWLNDPRAGKENIPPDWILRDPSKPIRIDVPWWVMNDLDTAEYWR